MLKNKYAQGLSIRFIILAVISLIVLVVLISIFSGKTDNLINTVKGAQSCDETCKIKDYSSGRSGYISGYEILVGAKDSNGNQCYCK
tara:strand:- start:232 stop:492 length:261 start_codon:yes stop_codon:yes gene_type:complete